jgi:Zn-dependent protease/CBS domain-containing protein
VLATRNGALRAGRMFGASLYLHRIWFVGCAGLAWMLASTHGLATRAGPAALSEWYVFLAGALLFHPLVLLQEAGHAGAARWQGRRVVSVTLFAFGAVSELEGEVEDPGTELKLAVAGPLTSLAAAALCAAAGLASPGVLARAVAWRLAWLNLALMAYSLLPVPPLNGIRLARALFWRSHGKTRAGELAARSGASLSLPLLALGLFALLLGRPALAPWFVLLGMALRLASENACRELRACAALEGARVEDAMLRPAPSVPAHISLAEAEDCCFRTHPEDALPVTRESTLVGILLRKDLRRYSSQDRQGVSVQAALRPLPTQLVIAPQEALSAGLARMAPLGLGSLFVVEDGRLVGVLTRGAIGRYAEARLLR